MQRWTDPQPPGPVPDPYARWARHTGWRGFVRDAHWQRGAARATGERVRLVARARDEAALDRALAWPGLLVPEVYRHPVPGSTRRSLHFTASLHPDRLEALATGLPELRWELAVPLRDADAPLRAGELGFFGPARDRPGTARQAPSTAKAPRAPSTAKAPRAPSTAKAPQAPSTSTSPTAGVVPGSLGDVIAVIDVGCPFLQRDFERATGTRIRALWDQQAATPAAPWGLPAGLGYGRELGGTALDALVAEARAGGGAPPAEERVYRRIGHLVAGDDPRQRVYHGTHGAHVLAMAAAGRDPLGDLRGHPLGGGRDAAGQAELVFVQLPSLDAADSSGGSLAANLLDGVRYVLAACRDDARIVVNISYGSIAGPHDGSALGEQALDELLELRPRNFAIVLGAGNSRLAACHAGRTLGRHGSVLLRPLLAAADTTDTFVEAWYTPGATPLRTRARTPAGDWSPWVAAGAEAVLRDDDGSTVALLAHQVRVPNGARALVLLATAPTAAPPDDPAALAPAGPWQIEIDFERTPADAAERVVVDAWVERDDPGEAGVSRQSAFADALLGDEDNTLSSLATGRHTLVAGALRLDGWAPAAYSSSGPQRGPGSALPLVYAAAEEDLLQPNLRAAAVRSGETRRMAGSSVAAPVLARRVYNRLCEVDIERADWRRALQQIVAADPAVLRHPAPGRDPP